MGGVGSIIGFLAGIICAGQGSHGDLASGWKRDAAVFGLILAVLSLGLVTLANRVFGERIGRITMGVIQGIVMGAVFGAVVNFALEGFMGGGQFHPTAVALLIGGSCGAAAGGLAGGAKSACIAA